MNTFDFAWITTPTMQDRIYQAPWMQPEPTRGGTAPTESPVKVWNGTEWVALPGPASP